MAEHVHDYGLRVVSELGSAYVEVACRGCGYELTGAEARRRINEYDKLKRATDALRVDVARYIAKMLDPRLVGSILPLIAYADILED